MAECIQSLETTMREMARRFASIASLLTLALLFGCGGSSGSTQPPAASALSPSSGDSFGISSDANFLTVDTGAGLVFKVRQHNSSGSTKGLGDITSMVYHGIEYQDGLKGSQVNSGFDYLYTGVSDVAVASEIVDVDHIKITVNAGKLTHYYLAQRGQAKIYMGTYFTSEPDTLNLARFIVRIPIGLLPNGPAPSDLKGNTGAIEAQDIFGMPNGETRSKHYSNHRLMDWSYIGATGSNVGIWIVRDNNEGNSGGPFYRSLLNQGTLTDQEITYIINYGEAQTEAFRSSILNAYTLAFTDGNTPDATDTSWFANMALTGYVGPAARGDVAGIAITGQDPAYRYTVGFSNSTAQYWTDAAPGDGHFSSPSMIPGTYTMRVYKNELAVDTRNVTVQAGQTTTLNTIAIGSDPSSTTAIWRIGDWDGTPTEFLNGYKVTTMHPSDVRMQSWKTADYVVGTSTPAAGFPAYQWKDVNGTITVRFNLRLDQISNMTLRVGITTAYANGRPTAKINSWTAPIPSASTQPTTRTLTIGSYRGNNTTFSYAIPASSLVVGENVLSLGVASGSGSTAYLSAGIAYDAVDLVTAQ
jgi:rhamnogalacturonan endolyase